MITVAACQVPVDIDDPEKTRRIVAESVGEAARLGARLVVLPELVLCGSLFVDAAESSARAEPLDGESVRFLADLSRAYGLVLVAGFCEVSGLSKPYNSAVVLDGGELLAVYRKTHLWDFERELFTPGPVLPPVVPTSVGVVAPLICYDLAFPEVLRSVALRGAQLVASPANWPDSTSPATRPPEVSKAMASAATNRLVVVVADRVGPERGCRWVGGSVVVDHEGYRLAGPDFGIETVLVAEVDLEATLDKRLGARNHVFDDRRLDLYASC